MGVLAEFVQNQAEFLRNQSKRREDALQDWLHAIKSLNQQLLSWVTKADGGIGLLEAHQTVELLRQEAVLGIYSVRGLQITIGGQFSGRSAEVIPRARYVTAIIKPPDEDSRRADGMVEIKSGGGLDYYYLFRLAGNNPDSDRWYIRSVADWNADQNYSRVDPLDQDRFEAAILKVLQ